MQVRLDLKSMVPQQRRQKSLLTLLSAMLVLLKYPFCYTIRRGFGKFFGMIHILTRHLAPELDSF